MNALGKMIPYLLSMLGKKPCTVPYPHVRAKTPETFRGALKLNSALCVGCKMCERVCPSGAIHIQKAEQEEKKFKAVLHLDKCIFCGQCADSCNKQALENTTEFELATPDKNSLTVEI